MSCYFRHIKNLLDEAAIEVTPSNKKQIDLAFHQIAGVRYKECPTTWKRPGNGRRKIHLAEKGGINSNYLRLCA